MIVGPALMYGSAPWDLCQLTSVIALLKPHIGNREGFITNLATANNGRSRFSEFRSMQKFLYGSASFVRLRDSFRGDFCHSYLVTPSGKARYGIRGVDGVARSVFIGPMPSFSSIVSVSHHSRCQTLAGITTVAPASTI